MLPETLRVCVVVFIHEKENLQYFSRLLSRHSLITCCNVSQAGYIAPDTFDFSQGHVTKNQPMAVPV